MRVNVYVDGFNLYYAVKSTPYKWLNPLALAHRLMPEHSIHRIRYFTARVRPRPNDPHKAQRQDLFVRALRTIPNLDIFWGQFVSRPREMPRVGSGPGPLQLVQVLRTEEKGSDVNLATWLLVDAFENDFEMAAVISNDSDLAEPIRVITTRFCLPVRVYNPQARCNASSELRNVATLCRSIKRDAFAKCQFPNTLTDANGTFCKPKQW